MVQWQNWHMKKEHFIMAAKVDEGCCGIEVLLASIKVSFPNSHIVVDVKWHFPPPPPTHIEKKIHTDIFLE